MQRRFVQPYCIFFRSTSSEPCFFAPGPKRAILSVSPPSGTLYQFFSLRPDPKRGFFPLFEYLSTKVCGETKYVPRFSLAGQTDTTFAPFELVQAPSESAFDVLSCDLPSFALVGRVIRPHPHHRHRYRRPTRNLRRRRRHERARRAAVGGAPVGSNPRYRHA